MERRVSILTPEEDRRATLRREVEGLGESGRAFRQGTENIRASIGYSLPGLARVMVGDEGGLAQIQEGERIQQEAAEFGPRVQSVEQIDGVGSGLEYARNLALTQLPNIATAVTGAGLAATGARVAAQQGTKALARKIASEVSEGVVDRSTQRLARDVAAVRGADRVARRVQQGALAGAAATGTALQTGETAGSVLDPEAVGDTQTNAQIAGLAALVGGSLETIPALALLRRYGVAGAPSKALTGGIIKRVGKAGAQQALREGGTELAQQAISTAAHATIVENPDVLGSDEALSGYMNALVGGALGGFIFGAPGGIRRGGSKAPTTEAENRGIFERFWSRGRAKPGDEIPLDTGSAPNEVFDAAKTAIDREKRFSKLKLEIDEGLSQEFGINEFGQLVASGQANTTGGLEPMFDARKMQRMARVMPDLSTPERLLLSALPLDVGTSFAERNRDVLKTAADALFGADVSEGKRLNDVMAFRDILPETKRKQFDRAVTLAQAIRDYAEREGFESPADAVTFAVPETGAARQKDGRRFEDDESALSEAERELEQGGVRDEENKLDDELPFPKSTIMRRFGLPPKNVKRDAQGRSTHDEGVVFASSDEGASRPLNLPSLMGETSRLPKYQTGSQDPLVRTAQILYDVQNSLSAKGIELNMATLNPAAEFNGVRLVDALAVIQNGRASTRAPALSPALSPGAGGREGRGFGRAGLKAMGPLQTSTTLIPGEARRQAFTQPPAPPVSDRPYENTVGDTRQEEATSGDELRGTALTPQLPTSANEMRVSTPIDSPLRAEAVEKARSSVIELVNKALPNLALTKPRKVKGKWITPNGATTEVLTAPRMLNAVRANLSGVDLAKFNARIDALRDAERAANEVSIQEAQAADVDRVDERAKKQELHEAKRDPRVIAEVKRQLVGRINALTQQRFNNESATTELDDVKRVLAALPAYVDAKTVDAFNDASRKNTALRDIDQIAARVERSGDPRAPIRSEAGATTARASAATATAVAGRDEVIRETGRKIVRREDTRAKRVAAIKERRGLKGKPKKDDAPLERPKSEPVAKKARTTPKTEKELAREALKTTKPKQGPAAPKTERRKVKEAPKGKDLSAVQERRNLANVVEEYASKTLTERTDTQLRALEKQLEKFKDTLFISQRLARVQAELARRAASPKRMSKATPSQDTITRRSEELDADEFARYVSMRLNYLRLPNDNLQKYSTGGSDAPGALAAVADARLAANAGVTTAEIVQLLELARTGTLAKFIDNFKVGMINGQLRNVDIDQIVAALYARNTAIGGALGTANIAKLSKLKGNQTPAPSQSAKPKAPKPAQATNEAATPKPAQATNEAATAKPDELLPKLQGVVDGLLSALKLDAVTVQWGRESSYDPKTRTVTLHNSLRTNRHALVETLYHEVGHVVMEDRFDGASAEVKAAIAKDFEAWRKAHEGKPKEAWVSRSPKWMGELVKQKTDIDPEYAVDFHEYMADNIAKALLGQPNKKLSMLDKFFVSIADSLRKLYSALSGSDYKATPSVQSWVDDMLGVRKVPKDKPALASTYFNQLPPEAREILEREFLKSDVFEQIMSHIKGNENTFQLENYATQFEALINAGAELYMQGKLKIVPEARGHFRQALQHFQDAFGFTSNATLTEAILRGLKDKRVNADFDVRRELADNSLKQASLAARRFFERVVIPPFRALLSDIDERVRRMPYPEARRIAAMVNLRTGERGKDESLSQAIQRERNVWLGEAFKIVDTMEPQLESLGIKQGAERKALKAKNEAAAKAAEDKKRRLLKSLQEGSAPDPDVAGEHAKIRKLLDRFYADYMNPAVVTINADGNAVKGMGQIENYFPVVMDPEAVRQNEGALRELLMQEKFKAPMAAYFKQMQGKNPWYEEVDVEDQKTMVDYMVKMARYDSDDVTDTSGRSLTDDKSSPGLRAAQPRVSGFIYKYGSPEDKATFATFQSKDLTEVLVKYFASGVKRAEYDRRFTNIVARTYVKDGVEVTKMVKANRIAKALKDMKKRGASAKETQLLRDYVDSAMGNYNQRVAPLLQKLAAWSDEYLNTNIGELNIRQLRTFNAVAMTYQNFRLLTLAAISSFVDPLGSYVRSGSVSDSWGSFREALRSMHSKEPDLLRQMAEDMGVVEKHSMIEAMAIMYGGSVDTNTLTGRANNALFRFNGLEYVTRLSRLAAFANAHRFLLRHAADTSDHSQRYLKELGLTPADIVMDERGFVKRNAKVDKALFRFVDEAVLRPKPTQRPLWQNDPNFAVIGQYKGFLYSLYNTIVRRMLNEVHHGNYRVLIALVPYIGVTMAVEALREFIQHGTEGNPQRVNWGVTDYMALAVDRTGLLGPKITAFADAEQDNSYGSSVLNSMAGPSAQQVGQWLDAATGERGLTRTTVEAIPASTVFEDWFL